MTLVTIDTSELKNILALEFKKHGITTNVEQLIKNNARALEGKRLFLRRYAPLLKREKRKGRYFYHLQDVQKFVGDYIEFVKNNKRANYPAPTLQKIHGLTLDDALGSFDDGVQSFQLADSMQLYTGKMYGEPTNVIVLNDIAYYLTDGIKDDDTLHD